MGLFDSLAGLFTGDPMKEAMEQQRQYLQGQQTQIGNLYDTARTGGLGALQSGQTGALGSVGTGIDTARADIMGGTAPALAALQQGTGGAITPLYQGQSSALDALLRGTTGASGAYNPVEGLGGQFGATGAQASNMTGNALGLNGAPGYDAAVGAFRGSPGYQYALEQGLDNVARMANTTGMLASGNTLAELQRRGQGMADQNFQQWLQNLQGREQMYNPMALQALTNTASGRAQAALTGGTGAANVFTGTGGRLSDLLSQSGQGAANIYTGTSRSLADLASRGGLAEADIYGTTAGRTADLYRGLAGGQAGAYGDISKLTAPTFGQEAQAELGGAKNLLNLIGSGVTFLGSGGLSSLGSLGSNALMSSGLVNPLSYTQGAGLPYAT